MQSADKKKNESVDLDTAITIAGLGKFHIGLLVLAGGCFGSTTMDNLGNSFVLPDVACELELSVIDKGLFSGATFLGMVLTGYVWGFASDTFGRRRVLMSSSVLSWLASFCASLAPVFWLLVFLRFLAGAALGGMASTVFTYTAEFLSPKVRTKYLSWSSVFDGIAFCLIPATAWLILPITWSLDLGFVVLKPWRILSIFNGIFILVTFFGMLGCPESPKYLISVNKNDEAIEVLRKVFALNTGRPLDEYPVRTIRKTVEDMRSGDLDPTKKWSFLTIFRAMKCQLVPIFGRKHLRTTILGCIVQFSLFASSCGFYLWMPDILNNMMNHNSTNPNDTMTVCKAINIRLSSPDTPCQSEISPTVYISSLVTGGSYCVGYLLIASFANAENQRTLLATFQIVGGIAGIAFYWATDIVTAGVLATVYMLPSDTGIILLSSMMSDSYPTHLRSAALCIALSIGKLGTSLFGVIIGPLLEYDCTSTIFGLGAMSIGTGLLSFFVPRPVEKVIESNLK